MGKSSIEEYWDYIKKYGNKITEENLKEIETVRVFQGTDVQ